MKRKRSIGALILALSSSLLITLSRSTNAMPDPAANATPQATRQDLIGTWQLVSIYMLGPAGRRNDPFYGGDPTGVLIYDPSGWMSVQIASRPRLSMDAPAVRPTRVPSPEHASLSASILETYYAYSATWDYDPAASLVTHTVKTSLLPDEVGRSYTQHVRLIGDTLTFTVHREDLGAGMVQKKSWRRVAGP